MARYIVTEKHPNHPEKHSRIWRNQDIDYFCNMGASAPLMETEVLVSSSFCCGKHRLPKVLANMKELRWINVDWTVKSSIFPSNFHPANLGCLMWKSSQVKQLWKGYKLLPNLKILDLFAALHLIETPDFNGLPCLERLILDCCKSLKDIHPSIGYHERLVYVDMTQCSKLKTFPPIIRMKRLETLKLSWCERLLKFPDIQTSMDGLVNLHLDHTGIEIIPPSVGQLCTSLLSLDLRECNKLKRIEGNFRLLRCLKYLHISGCTQLEELVWDFFDQDCYLEVLSLSIKSTQLVSTSFKNLKICGGLGSFHQDSSMSLKLPQFPRFLRKLELRRCRLGDGDIPSDLSELTNLQVLDLRENNFSQLQFSLSRIPCLKFLDLSLCTELVELPDLPQSIAILRAEECDSLQSVGDLSNYKCLWKVSLGRTNWLIGGERVVHSLLQVNAFEDRFMSVQLSVDDELRFYSTRPSIITLQFPRNWYSDFSGFLVYTDKGHLWDCNILIKRGMSMDDSEPHHDHWEEFNKNFESYKYAQVGYVPYSSLGRVPWWNSACTCITLQIEAKTNFEVGFVPKKGKSGETTKARTGCSDFWDKVSEDRKTFYATYDSKSSNVKIEWCH